MSTDSSMQSSDQSRLQNFMSTHLDENTPLDKHLVEIIRLNTQAEQGFRKAASLMSSDQDELLFTAYADQHARFASTLQSFIDDDNSKTSSITSVAEQLAAQAHRAWMGLRATFAGSELRAMLLECLRGEEVLAKHYDHAIKASPSRSEVHNLLAQQRADIKSVNQTLERLSNESEQA